MAGLDVLVLGAGAREHALAWRLARDESVGRVRIAPGNGGTAACGTNLPDLDPLDPAAVARYAANQRIGLVVVGGEAPLEAGVADALEQASVPVCGPTRTAARLETSKVYAREQMRRAGLPTADGVAFTDPEAAIEHVRRAAEPPVVKADWPAAGKGVIVPDSAEAAEAAIRALLAAAPRGAAVILERRLRGREVSVFGLVCGERVLPLGAACDYKRLADGDVGPNTGGMGAYSPVPWFSPRGIERTIGEIFEPIAWRMARDGTPYRGALYAGLMLTEDGPMLLEFNARLGDPEAQVLLPMLDGDLAQALLGVATNDMGLADGALRAHDGAAVGVVVASQGYPDESARDRPVDGVEPSGPSDDGGPLIFHGATRREGGDYRTTGGRVATLVGRGADLAAAREAAYRGVANIALEGEQHRSDIALREMDA